MIITVDRQKEGYYKTKDSEREAETLILANYMHVAVLTALSYPSNC